MTKWLDDPVATFIPERPLNTDFGSAASFEKARIWIKTCIAKSVARSEPPYELDDPRRRQRISDNHSHCQAYRKSPMPTRVLDLEDPNNIRVKSTEGELDDYVAISYCWETTPNLVTTRNTLCSRMGLS